MSQGKTYEERMQDHVKAVSDVANALSPRSCSDFAREFSREHRTIAQNFTRLCVSWLEELAKQTNYDMRNEASVKLAKEFVAKIEERGLPYI